MEKGKKAKEIAGQLVKKFLKVWLCGRAFRLPATHEVLNVLENAKTDVEALEKLQLEGEKG
jgi:hypothetical protein